jgi:hypothetical protein
MQLCEAREQYVRWLLVAKDLSPHTIRAYDSDIAASPDISVVARMSSSSIVTSSSLSLRSGGSLVFLRARSAGARLGSAVSARGY